jgi:hypothetical protein
MKKLLFIAAFIGSLIVTPAVHAVGVLVPLYNSISNQYYLATNTPPVDVKLAKSLNAALSAINKSGGGTNLATAIKALGSAAKVINRTSVSNVLYIDLQGAVAGCIDGFAGSANVYSNLLVTVFPSSQKISAQNAISNLLATLSLAGTTPNISVAVKYLGVAGKQLKSVQKAVTSAQGVPPPAASMTATISVSGASTVNFHTTNAVASQPVPGNFNVIAAQVATSGSGLNTHIDNYTISWNMNGLVSGVNNISNPVGSYVRNSGSISGPDPISGAFPISSGSVQATWDPANLTVYGSFSFNVAETSGALRAGTVTGTFTLYYQ